jgi:1-acyl-sn-glycerol-3-phosphate acyltransferase
VSESQLPPRGLARFLPAPVVGAIMFTLFVVNTVFWVIPVYAFILVKLVTPRGRARDAVSRLVAATAQQWAGVNTLIAANIVDIDWDIRFDAQVSPQGQYLVACNHQSWNDIFVLMRTFGFRAPFFKFFIKQELIWVPLLGLCWWGLDYPFMKRYTPEQLEKNPSLRGKDLETTRIACARFKNQPALILNFLEGTRFTPAKHDRQQSPYRWLLKPKSGGFAFSLSALGEKLNSLLDVTIVYPEGAKGFWDLMAGRVRRVIVEVRQLTIPHEFFVGSYETDPEFRRRFQEWIAALWAEKDKRIGEMRSQAAT